MGPTIDRRGRRVLLVSVVACAAIAGGMAPAMAQDAPTGGLSGLVLDPSGRPAEGFRLVFLGEDDLEHVSGPSDDLGRYSLSVPAGASYRLVAALAPDGTRLDVPELPPIPVDEGVRRMDVRIRYATPSPSGPGGTAAGKRRWWQMGAATAATVVFVTSVLDGSGEKRVSPFLPQDR